jgi:hypothetical protein
LSFNQRTTAPRKITSVDISSVDHLPIFFNSWLINSLPYGRSFTSGGKIFKISHQAIKPTTTNIGVAIDVHCKNVIPIFDF